MRALASGAGIPAIRQTLLHSDRLAASCRPATPIRESVRLGGQSCLNANIRQTPLKNLIPLIDGCRRIETRLETGF
jgi:hypothetical protein